jgi:threonine dehydrogenase-like Zn-dependent dehydrogenase
MKAVALIPGTTQLSLVDLPEPSITASDEIKLQVLQVGICGTDCEEASGGRAEAPSLRTPDEIKTVLEWREIAG